MGRGDGQTIEHGSIEIRTSCPVCGYRGTSICSSPTILGVLAAAALGALLTRTAPPRFGLPWAGTAVGAICLLVAIYDMANLSTEDEEFFGKMIGPDIGWGLWLLLLSSIALCATATIAAIQMRRS